ncbi:hypothetical protein [Bifidobacterium sp. ESL0745]|uniref:hypothetical protein n=1 Tax=Bifidobacterium sp. ESL0745 TaxID=2983226 RepID=UPI0023F89482|nr:hypothetical protein [Bifidobacterium sp. ESL0745]MDF7665501.1 hypothetical protein [Bifidobacterium sp. ESL0745]
MKVAVGNIADGHFVFEACLFMFAANLIGEPGLWLIEKLQKPMNKSDLQRGKPLL